MNEQQLPWAICTVCVVKWQTSFRYEWPLCPKCKQPAIMDRRTQNPVRIESPASADKRS